VAKFMPKNLQEKPEKRKEFSNSEKSTKMSRISSLVPLRPIAKRS